MENTQQNKEQIFAKYQNEIHLLGRVGLVLGLGLLLAVPFLFAKILNTSIKWAGFWNGFLQIAPLYIPSCIMEFFVYVPMLGAGASYLAFITGNLVNLKIPCAVNARDLCKTKVGTPENEIVSTLSVATSALVTTAVLGLGVLCLVPLTPLLENPVLQPAFDLVIPALFGALGYKYFTKSLQLTAAPLLVMTGLCILIPSLTGQVSIMMLAMGALTIVLAFVLWKTDKLKLKE